MSYAEIKASKVRKLAAAMVAQIDEERAKEVAALDELKRTSWFFKPSRMDYAFARTTGGAQQYKCRKLIGLCDLAGPDGIVRVSVDDVGALGLAHPAPAHRDMEASRG